MRLHLTKHSIIAVCAAISCTLFFSACHQKESISQAQIDSLQSKLDSIMVTHNQVKDAEGGQFEGQLAVKDSTITSQAAQIQSLLNQLSAAKKAQQQNGNANATGSNKDQIKQQQKQLKEKQSMIDNLQKQVNQQQKELKKLQNSSAKGNDNSGDIARLQRQIREQQQEIASLTQQVQNNSKSGNTSQKQCEQEKSELNSQIKKLKTQLSDINAQLKTAKQSNDDNKATAAEVNHLQQQVKSLQNQLAAAQNQSNNVNKKAVELSDVQSELSQCQSTQQNLRKQIGVLNNAIAQRDTTIEQLKHKSGDNNGNVTQLTQQLSALQQKYDNCQKQNETLIKEQRRIQSEYAEQINKAQNSTAGVDDKVSRLQAQVDALTVENNRLKSNMGGNDNETITNLQSELSQQQKEINKLQSQLDAKEAALKAAKSNGGKVTASSVNAKLQELQTLCDGYVQEIARLKAENDALKAENASLKETNAQAQQVLADNANLVKKVKLASVLVTSDVSAKAGKNISGNTLKEVTKASQTKLIRIDAHILANNVIDPGSVTVYARIANASNRVVCNGSPSDLSFDMNGVDMQYTTSQDIEFTGAARNITMVWRKFDNVTLDPGLYWVTLYANGYEIGKASFTLK